MKYNDKQFIYWIWYSRIENVSSLKKCKLLTKYKNVKEIFNLDEESLLKEEYLNSNDVSNILKKQYKECLKEYCKYLLKNNIKMITLFDKEYPEKLKLIYDKPVTLFAKGNIELLNKKGVAIVGSRNCSEYGKNISRRFAYELSKQNICIISGLAKGIDKYAHTGALEANGNTIAVIGNGLDYIYPFDNKNLYERIVNEDSLIITEYIIGTKPNRLNFPERNRIISALSDAILVVEAGKRSGSLITADFGLEHGKEIFAVPGNIDNYNSIGTNELIKQGATLVTESNDIVDVLDF
ncbi:MAG: DNA-processing protein DprA [Clostridia bacterium]|nr:DNA-processing protein DprA [Clostridia bacterium]